MGNITTSHHPVNHLLMSKRSTILETHQLGLGYPEKSILLFNDLNLKLQEGELVCFMGPNGIGKSTLIRTLAGLQPPLKGKIVMRGPSSSLPEKIAVVLTEKLSLVNMTVYELITFGRYPYIGWNVKLQKHDKDLIEQAISFTRLEELRDKKLYELSDGQLQMTMIARALAQDTPLVLLDEPTAHLDLNNRLETMKLLRKLTRSTKKSFLVSTHELDLALQTADQLWLAGRNGKIYTGIPEDLVLTGRFDEIFEFKGFDLKTGKVQQELKRSHTIELQGEGYAFLWTKNALERNGYPVNEDHPSHAVAIVQKNAACFQWIVNKEKVFESLADLLDYLNTEQ
jgi:iron complex transport system ATP-binding protein